MANLKKLHLARPSYFDASCGCNKSRAKFKYASAFSTGNINYYTKGLDAISNRFVLIIFHFFRYFRKNKAKQGNQRQLGKVYTIAIKN